jgi:signal transduction histidine kinase
MDVLIPILAIFSIFFVPITGVMLILVSKYALKPMVETLSQALRDSRQPDPASLVQIQDLADQVETLTAEVRRLQEVQAFDRKLLATAERRESGGEP